MRGTIYLAGGGSPDDEHLLWDQMLRSGMRVLYWPFALSGPMLDGAHDWLNETLRARWPSVRLTTWAHLDGRDPRELQDFDLLFVGGGNTFDLLEHVRAHGFMEPILQFVADGGAYYGGSAGAILAAESIDTAELHDENHAGLSDTAGLGLVRNLLVMPHYITGEDMRARAWCRRRGTPVLGIPEQCGVAITPDGAARIAGTAPASLVRHEGTLWLRPGESRQLDSAFPGAGSVQ